MAMDEDIFARWLHTTHARLQNMFRQRVEPLKKKTRGNYTLKGTSGMQADRTIREHKAKQRKHEEKFGLNPLDRFLTRRPAPQKRRRDKAECADDEVVEVMAEAGPVAAAARSDESRKRRKEPAAYPVPEPLSSWEADETEPAWTIQAAQRGGVEEEHRQVQEANRVAGIEGGMLDWSWMDEWVSEGLETAYAMVSTSQNNPNEQEQGSVPGITASPSLPTHVCSPLHPVSCLTQNILTTR
jgi:hypothetical protein